MTAENTAYLGWCREQNLGKRLGLRAKEEDLSFSSSLVGDGALYLSSLVCSSLQPSWSWEEKVLS